MTVSFEVYTKVRGRWEIHTRYDRAHREEALAEALLLEKEPHVELVRVVREDYDELENVSNETVIYETSRLKGRKGRDDAFLIRGDDDEPRSGGGRRRFMRYMGRVPEWAEDSEDEAKRLSVAEILPRVSVAFLVSTIGSTLTGYLTLLGLSSLHDLGFTLGRLASQIILVGAFALSFIAMFIPTLRRVKLRAPDASRKPAPNPAPEPVEPASQAAPEPEPEPEPEEEPDDPEERAAEALAALQAAGIDVDSLDQDDEDWLPDTVGQQEQNAPRSAAVRPQTMVDADAWLERFMEHALAPVADRLGTLDAFNRFGLTLYVAGAGEYIGVRYGLRRDQVLDILTGRVQTLGHDETMALGFCANIDEYLLQPRYLRMYDRGRTAMREYLEDQTRDAGIVEALEEWNRPAGAGEDSQTEFVVVLFTDIVGSTAMGQELGDQRGMEVVRAHNTIVREALTMYGGQEVKHMGDGIMAVFSSVPSAVHAAIAMQQGIQAHNRVDAERRFEVRIGINAGEPIREGGDFFGTPVQLAARVMSKAGAREIAVSHIVRELYTAHDVVFRDAGEFELKGFKEPVPIFMVMWDQEGGRADASQSQATVPAQSTGSATAA